MWVTEEDNVGSLHVESIEPDGIVLSGNGKTYVLGLNQEGKESLIPAPSPEKPGPPKEPEGQDEQAQSTPEQVEADTDAHPISA